MSLRKIHIANKKARNTIINFKGHTPASRVYKVDEGLNKVYNRKIIKGVAAKTFDGLVAEFGGDLEKMAELLISGDPEIDYEVTGRFLGASPKVYINEALKVVYRVNKIERVFDSTGELKEERALRQLDSNITSEVPLKWSGKYFDIDKYYNKFVFVRTYQLFHDSGLTYDFLYDMAKELENKKSFLLLGSGAKGVGPIIFQEGGQPYRVFLEGRTKNNDYMLLMHLSNLEFKAIDHGK